MKTFKFNICKYTVTIMIEKKVYGTSSTDQKESGMRDVTYTPADQWVSTVNEPDYAQSHSSVYECCQEYIKSQYGILSESTLKNYKNIIENHFEYFVIDYMNKIDEEVIQKAFDREIDKGLSVKTLKGYRSFFLKVLSKYRPDLTPNIRVEKEASNEIA